MKIDNSRIVIAEVHKVIGAKSTTHFEFGGVSVGSTEYKTEKCKDNCVFIKFKTKFNGTIYVPVEEIKNFISYLGFKKAAEHSSCTYGDERFLTTSETCAYSGKFLKDVQLLYDCEGKTSLKDIKDVQARHKESYSL